MIRLLLACALALLASCGSPGARMSATGTLTGDVRTDGAGTWVAIGEADLVVEVRLAGGPMVFVPVAVARGHVWALAPDGTEIEQPLADPLPPWVIALYEPGELERLVGLLTAPPPAF